MMDDKVKILIVDDERVVREGCNRVLSGKGYDVLMAENGKLAMEIIAVEYVDIILLDLKMPVMSGEEVLEQVSSQYPDVPVIIITGHGTIDTAVECMKKGAYDKAKEFQAQNVRNLYDLNLEKSRLKTIINCMANGVMVTNRNLEIVLHNPALMRLLEISEEIENPISVTRIIHSAPLIATLKEIQSEESPGNEFVSQEIELENNTLRAITAPAIGPDDGIVGTVTVLEDISAFKKLDEMKSDFVNMVAHELRSPLVSIRQQNSVLLEGLAGPLQEKQKEFIGRGTQKIDQLLALINELLDIARIEAGKHVQHQVPLNIENIIRETVALIEARAAKKGIEIRSVFQDLKPVQADPKGIEEIFNNLITNAVNYSLDSGKVDIHARGLGEYIEIKVSDTGVGIDPEELPKIFDKFYRVKHPKTRKVMGTGLGLAIVKGIVDAHHGTIDVESVPDKGTTFRILLPAISSDE